MAGSRSRKTPPAQQRPKHKMHSDHANSNSRSSLRDAHADEEPRLHRRGRAHVGPRHRGQHRHFQHLGLEGTHSLVTLTHTRLTMSPSGSVSFAKIFETGSQAMTASFWPTSGLRSGRSFAILSVISTAG